MRLIGHEVAGKDATEESEEVGFPRDVCFAGENAIHHSAVEESNKDGDSNPAGAFLDEPFDE